MQALIERDEEYALLENRIEALDGGQGATVAVSAAGGLGKTRLLDRVVRAAQARGFAVLSGAGRARVAAVPYWPLTDILRAYLGAGSQQRTAVFMELVGHLAPHLWQALFPREAPPPAVKDAAAKTELHQDLFVSQLVRLLLAGNDAPLLICLEDLHWADSATLKVWQALGRDCAGHPVLLLATYRPAKRADLQAAVAAMESCPHFAAIELEPLSLKGTGELIASHLGPADFSGSLLTQLHRQSGGIPLYILQYLEMMRENGDIFQKRGLWVNRQGSLGVPDSIRAILEQRCKSLTEDQRHLLGHGAVQGDVFAVDLVAQTLGWTEATVLQMLEQVAHTTHLVRRAGKDFRFCNSVLAEFFYGFLPESIRRQTHARLALALEKRQRHNVEALADHYFRGGAFGQALPYLIEAGRRARVSCAFKEAMAHFNQALEAIREMEPAEVGSRHFEVLLDLAEIEEKAGDLERAMQLCNVVIEADFGQVEATLGRALMRLGSAMCRWGAWREAAEHYERASGIFAKLGDSAKEATIALKLGIIDFERGALKAAKARFENAKATATRCNDYSLLGSISGNLGVVASVEGRYRDAIASYTEALEAYRKAGNKYGLCQSYHNLGLTCAACGEWPKALKAYDKAEELARDIGTVDVLANIMVSRPPAHLAIDQVDRAESVLAEARGYMVQLGDRLGLAECDKVEGMIMAARADFAGAQECLLAGRRAFDSLENLLGVAECDVELARLLARWGRGVAARRRFEQARKLFEELGVTTEAKRVAAECQKLAIAGKGGAAIASGFPLHHIFSPGRNTSRD